ncbi:hypothetical protein MTR67_002312 [Solanum verrucosum]|uniref:Gag-pol polyprotein n=1 Tax=Solanum verrucosum TaxID=315347 RepID=A0AAF0PQR3_SOLVR|nr:hypothetical protein MTR67_002312 [Solanum verrucosum]
MIMMEYALKFAQLAMYAPTMVAESRAIMRGKSGGSSMPNCIRCGRKHDGKCLAGTDGCFNCGKSGHNMSAFLFLATKGRDGRQAQLSGSGSGAPKQN